MGSVFFFQTTSDPGVAKTVTVEQVEDFFTVYVASDKADQVEIITKGLENGDNITIFNITSGLYHEHSFFQYVKLSDHLLRKISHLK